MHNKHILTLTFLSGTDKLLNIVSSNIICLMLSIYIFHFYRQAKCIITKRVPDMISWLCEWTLSHYEYGTENLLISLSYNFFMHIMYVNIVTRSLSLIPLYNCIDAYMHNSNKVRWLALCLEAKIDLCMIICLA